MRNWLFPWSVDREYKALLLSYVKSMDAQTRKRLKELDLMRQDAPGDWSEAVAALFLELLAAFLDDGQSVVARLPNMFTTISKFNDTQWRLQVKAGTGLEIGPSGALPFDAKALGSVSNPQSVRAVFGMGVDVYRSEPWLKPLQENWIAQNVTLIKSVPEQYLNQVQGAVRRGVMEGQSIKTISENLQKIEGITENRANLIAADQVAKANAALSEHRMTDLGIEEYTWQTVHDERVRPAHAASDGDRLAFKTGNPKDHNLNPGQPVRCRCWARPVFPDDEDETPDSE